MVVEQPEPRCGDERLGGGADAERGSGLGEAAVGGTPGQVLRRRRGPQRLAGVEPTEQRGLLGAQERRLVLVADGSQPSQVLDQGVRDVLLCGA